MPIAVDDDDDDDDDGNYYDDDYNANYEANIDNDYNDEHEYDNGDDDNVKMQQGPLGKTKGLFAVYDDDDDESNIDHDHEHGYVNRLYTGDEANVKLQQVLKPRLQLKLMW